MAIVQTLDASSIDLSSFIDADLIRVGEAYARLANFMASDATSDVFACDAGTYSALRRAACRIIGSERDKVTTYTLSRKPGTKQWKRVKSGATPPQSHETKTGTIKSYSSDTVRNAIATLRNDHGIAIRRDATRKMIGNEEYLVVALVRETADGS